MKNLFFLLIIILTLHACTKEVTTTPPPPPIMEMIPAPFTALQGIFGGAGVGASVNIGDEIILFFSADGKQYAWFEDTELKFTRNINATDSHFGGYLLDDVGAAIDFEEEQLYFFNDSGDKYQEVSLNPDLVPGNSADITLFTFSPNILELEQWGTPNSCPFDELGSAFGFSKEPQGCAMVGDDDDFLWFCSENGDMLSRYVKESKSFDPVVEVALWRAENVCGGSPKILPISTIGASCIYEPEGEDLRELFFSEDGQSLTILNTTNSEYSEVFSLK